MKRSLRFVLLLLLIATVWLYSTINAQSARAQSTSGTTVETLTFHYYSLMQKAENGSYFAYDGVDAVGPRRTSAFQTNLNSQIKGTESGFTYWSAAVVWVVELKKDVHVLGNVEIKAYISSTFGGFGFLDGGGYGMGLIDIDENENDVKEFIVQAPYSIGSNPFTATPTAYSLNLDVDYVFKKGHYLGFFVGAGATIKGFTFTVYFDSSDRKSGALLPIEDQTETFRFDAVWGGETYEIVAISNSSLSNFGFNQPEKQISFNASGIRGTSGYCRVWIPKTLLEGPFKVFIGSQQITPTETENTTHSSVYFTYTHDPEIIKIVAESTTPPPVDITPPTITHTPTSTANDGQTITISATITDNVAVTEAKLYCRKVGESTYTSIVMTPSGSTYVGTISASMVTTAGVQYYINATDGTNFSTHPAANPTTSPHTITVILMNIPPPAVTLNNPSNITQNSMKLVWTQNTEADFARYEIYQSPTSGTLGTKIHAITDRSITSYTVTELSADTTYYFTVRVVDTAGLFADSVQVNGRTTQSSQTDGTDGTETMPPSIWWVVGGVVAISAALIITIVALRQRKK